MDYGYYDDGRLKHAWDTTNEWFDRAYKYDHASRLKEASTFRRARGLSPYPAIAYPDPYFQSITYDAFNHSNRTGKLYTGEPSDIGTYANNRRNGWSYDADGNNTSNSSYQQTFDAAGVTVRSVSQANVGDGVQYPIQPRLDITQSYDSVGAPAKRVQISRQPGLIDEFGNPTEPIEDTQTTHYVKSTVLGGVTVAELGWGDTIHVYAGGQRIARELWGNVTFEHHNPMTGSWVTSHGHSSYRTTNREERDPRGAETPVSNPYGSAGNYVDWKFSQPLFIDGNDPFDYVSGYTKDGLPMTRGDLGRILGKLGPAGFLLFDAYRVPKIIYLAGEHEHYLAEFERRIIAISVDRFFQRKQGSAGGKIGAHLPVGLQNPNQNVLDLVNRTLNVNDCEAFLRTVLNKASTKANPVLEGGDIRAILADFLAQKNGGVDRTRVTKWGSASGRIGRNGDGNGVLFLRSYGTDQDWHDASGIINELPHLAGSKGGWPREEYDDYALAVAVWNSGYAQTPKTASTDPFFDYMDLEKAGKSRPARADARWSNYFHHVLRLHCVVPTQ